MKYHLGKIGVEFKWVLVTEYENKAIHHHVIINDAPGLFEIVKKQWKYGRPNFTPLDDDVQGLAEYLVKETNKTFRNEDNVNKRVKVPASTPKRKQRMVCLMSEEEVRIVDCYLKKYKITNKARWLRETVLTFIHQKMK